VFYQRIAALLAWVGVIDRERLDRTVSLSWPRIVTGFAIMSKQTVDLALVGWAVGSAAVAGLAYAYAYWTLGKFVGIGLAGGVAVIRFLLRGEDVGFTTSVTVFVVALLGVLVGYGRFFESTSIAIVSVLLLAEGDRLHRYVDSLTDEELVELVNREMRREAVVPMGLVGSIGLVTLLLGWLVVY